MSEILDTIDKSLQEVEEQLLQEFDRIRNSLSDARFAPVDLGVKNALSGVVTELYELLDQSGDRLNLQLMTEAHEVLLTRIVVIRRLLDANVPTAYLHEAHNEVVTNRRLLEARVVARRSHKSEAKSATNSATRDSSPDRSTGFMGKLKGMFGSKTKTNDEESRNRIRVTEEEAEALEPVNIYLDNGIYSASRELAALSSVFDLPDQRKDSIQANHARRIAGKAQFASRDLSNQPPEDKPRHNFAQTQEGLNRKPPERQSKSGGKASFVSKDIEPVRARDVQKAKLTAAELAKQRKADLDKEKAQQPTTGKASFLARDLEPTEHQEVSKRRIAPESKTSSESKTEPKEEKPRTGKAVFESKELTGPRPPKR